MKTKFAMLLTLVFLLSILLPACQSGGDGAPSGSPESSGTPESAPQKEVPILNVEADIGPLAGDWVMQFLQSVPGYGTDFVAISETTPRGGQNRDNTLTRLKTEIMAGKGPDLFLCTNYTYGDEGDLFPFPQKAMKNHLLLPLDGYIENAEYMEWDKMNPMVMSAGRNKEGQYLLPMSYTFPATVYNMTGQEGDPLGQIDKTTTWEDMCASDDPFIRNAAILYASPSWNRVASILGPLDDGHENITFTQEELRDVYDIGVEQGIEESSTLVVADGVTVKPAETGLPQNYTLDMGRGFTLPEFGHMLPDFSDWEMAIVPLCSREGGVTATVSSYCAISSDTADPERAFRLVDYILSEENQQNSSFNFDMGWNSLPVYDGLMTEDKQLFQAITSLPDPHWFLSDGNYQQFSRVRDLITQAKLFTKADEYVTLGFVREMFPDEHQEDQAEWACREIKMGLAES